MFVMSNRIGTIETNEFVDNLWSLEEDLNLVNSVLPFYCLSQGVVAEISSLPPECLSEGVVCARGERVDPWIEH